jgi:ABC-type lipoprotein export system ATPase subunit
VEFKAGEFVAIMGDSGVGKSTLLNLIAGLDTPDAAPGESPIMVDGIPMSGLDDDAATKLRRARMGFIFQAFHVLPHLTLLQNVALPLLLNGLPTARAARCWTRSAWAAANTTSPTNSPADKCSAWPSPARWCTARPWSSPMNRLVISIQIPPTPS